MERRLMIVAAATASLMLVGSLASADHNGTQGIVGGFEIDGNFSFDGLTVGGQTATRDWANVGEVTVFPDEFDGDGNAIPDDIFGGGAKEQEPQTWSFTTGKPPGKDDITKIYAASEVSLSSARLWVGFERLAVQGQGDAHVNFELNRKTSTVTNSKGAVIPERSPDDLLVVYDYSGGTGPVNVQVMRWIGTALAGSWVPAALPAGSAHGDINAGSVPRPAGAPFGGGSVAARRFGEAGIDAFAIFGPGFVSCPGFGQIWAKSRSSGESFNAALQDVTARVPFDFSSCGSITVLKRTDHGGDQTDLPLNGSVFEAWLDDGDGVFEPTIGGDSLEGTCTAGEGGIDGQCTFEDLEPGTYFIREVQSPDGYVLDTTVKTVTIGFREHKTISEPFFDPKIRYRLTLSPVADRNLTDTDHQIDALLERSLDRGVTWSGAPNEAVSFSLAGQGQITSIVAAGPSANTCSTDSDGRCVVTIRSADPGGTTLTGSFEKVTATTPATAGGSAGKTWVAYRVLVDPGTDENLVNTDHVFTVTIQKNEGNGWEPAVGAVPSATLTGAGSVTGGSCPAGTNAMGQCTIIIRSAQPGSSTISVSYQAAEGSTSGAFAGSAEKRWIDFRIDVSPDVATNPVKRTDGDKTPVPHVFTVTLERNDGGGWAGVAGAFPTITRTGVGFIQNNRCAAVGTDTAGRCTVTITALSAGTTTVTASYLAVAGATSRTVSDAGVKHWHDFRVTVTPGRAFNKTGDPHTFTIRLERNTGSGWTGFAGETVSLALSPEGVAEFTEINGQPASGTAATCTTNASGRCTAIVDSVGNGSVTLTAAWSGVVGGIDVSRRGSGEKIYLDVAVFKSACPEDTSPPGGRVDYTVEIRSAGATLTGVVVTDDLPGSVTLVSASDLAGTAPILPAPGPNGTIRWEIGALAPGVYQATVTVTVNDDAAEGAEITNTATFVANEFAGDPEVASHTITVAAGGEADARAYGASVQLLGNQVLAPTPDSDEQSPDELLSIPSPFGSGTLVRLLGVDETVVEDATSTSSSAVATTAAVDINPGPVRVQASAIVARSGSEASIADAGSSSGGSRVADLVVNGVRHGDITEPVTLTVNHPLTGQLLAEVHVLEETPSGAAAGVSQPNGNGEFASGLAVNGIRVVVHDVAATPIDESSEIIVAHAGSSASFTSGLGCYRQPSVGGDASIVSLFNLEPDVVRARLGHAFLPSTGGSDRASFADVTVPSLLGSVTGEALTSGWLTPQPEAVSSARVEGLGLGPISARLIEAKTGAVPGDASGETTIVDLVINGTNVCEALGLTSTCTPPPNTVFLLPGGGPVLVMLNEQLPVEGGIRVNAVHIWVLGRDNPLNLPAGAEIVISSARASSHPL